MRNSELYDRLCDFVTPHKRALFDRIARDRSKHVTAVLENTYQTHNASAVLRTADLLGMQEVHVIETQNKFDPNKDIALGASRWLDIHSYRDTDDPLQACIDRLRYEGRTIVATSPRADAHTPESIPLDAPLAICFGTELHGMSERLTGLCDASIRIPMYGFTESYNISVSAAIVLYTIKQRIRNSAIDHRINDNEQIELKLKWVRAMLPDHEAIEARIRAESA